MSTPTDRELRAWAYLSAVAEPPCAAVIALVGKYGAEEAARMVAARSFPADQSAVAVATEARAATVRAELDLEVAHRRGARLLTPAHDDWPAWSLLALDNATSSARGGAPLALWVRGELPIEDATAAAIGVVGSRAATSYGDYLSTRLGSDLAAAGWTVVSGAAFGIDGAAHRGALTAGGTTVAVLACGIDRDYPAGHSRLLDEIAERGLIISEYSPGTTAGRHRFLTRNRLVAALSGALVVVEAGRRSGAANTAAWARLLGRPLGAMPGPLTSAMSVGCHQMIADGEASLVMDAASAIALVSPDGHDNHRRSTPRQRDSLPPDQFQVIEALPAHGSLRLDEVAFVAGLPVVRVRSALAALEVKGLVDGGAGDWSLVR